LTSYLSLAVEAIRVASKREEILPTVALDSERIVWQELLHEDILPTHDYELAKQLSIACVCGDKARPNIHATYCHSGGKAGHGGSEKAYPFCLEASA